MDAITSKEMVKIARLEEQVTALEKWVTKQNGTIQRVDEKIDKLQSWIMGVLFVGLMNALGLLVAVFKEAVK